MRHRLSGKSTYIYELKGQYAGNGLGPIASSVRDRCTVQSISTPYGAIFCDTISAWHSIEQHVIEFGSSVDQWPARVARLKA